MRGEYLPEPLYIPNHQGSPPLARGVLTDCFLWHPRKGITPACAGSTQTFHRGLKWRKDHPRLRGEYRNARRVAVGSLGSPPLARGVQRTQTSYILSKRITPACAGSTLHPWLALGCMWDHPRLRGEYFLDCKPNAIELGSPPLARGVLGTFVTKGALARITPACAGSTKYIFTDSYVYKDHPRLRGEYELLGDRESDALGSPPLARGVLTRQSQILPWVRITPACAGSTDVQITKVLYKEDHPRLRGEYTVSSAINAAFSGSPPLARGVQKPCKDGA